MNSPSPCGWSASRSGCRAPSWSPSSTTPGRTTTTRWPPPRQTFGDKVLPLYLPANSPCTGLVGLLSQTHYEYNGGKRTTKEPDSSYSDRLSEQRGTLIEGIIEESEDETLMERYLGGEEIDEKVLIEDLEKAVARGSFFR